MKRIKITLVSLFICLFVVLSTGCVQQTYRILINDDESVSYAIEVILPKDSLEILEKYNIQREEIIDDPSPLFKQIYTEYEALGFTKTIINDEKGVLLKLLKTYPNIMSFNEEMQKLSSTGKSGLAIKLSSTNNLMGRKKHYKGAIRYFMDTDFVDALQKTPELKAIIENKQLTATLYIYDEDKSVVMENVEKSEDSVISLVSGDYQLGLEQPIKYFEYSTSFKNPTMALVQFGGAFLLIGGLLIVFFLKGKNFNLPKVNKLFKKKEESSDET